MNKLEYARTVSRTEVVITAGNTLDTDLYTLRA